ncbi:MULTISPECIES: twin-arginine translocase subunit TatC [Mediterranea]|uniref:twin-arginine translocase subunit TatC n=1 Tax=Mediterranea TaxID=1926659 RepID=UPI002011B2E1|nr:MULTISPECIES: twin-arginine translocase subunit TatC [Mediterranea]MCL1606999.1 twin-arginine translocase subunit TatC [Mediterranea sp. ET5]MDM8121725.1 twin-arginine translocase subunit TatC [Mediterranea massiliensis]MDM8197510.1 twin-arginine translocase subunit TatC [Mediterranea massiliensis]
MTDNNSAMTFWDHLDVLRGSLLRMAVVTVACAVVAFAFKDAVFAAILAPKHDDFILYRLLAGVNSWLADGSPSSFHVELINTGLAEQFKIHVKTSLYVGLMAASPYCLYELFRFVSPGLYPKERRYGVRAVVSGYVMFLLGVALCYFLIFPLTFRFLGTYQVSPDVENLITLQSYMDTLLVMCFLLGILFELPIVCWVLGKLGILRRTFMRRYRKHAVVVILVVSAIITPTSDIFTLCIVALPICLLYEVSTFLVKD